MSLIFQRVSASIGRRLAAMEDAIFRGNQSAGETPAPKVTSAPAAPKHGRPATRGRRHRSQRSRANRRKARRME